jgi:hypothetical protein
MTMPASDFRRDINAKHLHRSPRIWLLPGVASRLQTNGHFICVVVDRPFGVLQPRPHWPPISPGECAHHYTLPASAPPHSSPCLHLNPFLKTPRIRLLIAATSSSPLLTSSSPCRASARPHYSTPLPAFHHSISPIHRSNEIWKRCS